MQDDRNVLQAALEYAAQGLAVFPLQPRSKEPATPHGCKDATTDTAQIEQWFRGHDNYNLAIATGEKSGGLTVIDLDIEEDKGINGYESITEWQRSHGTLTDTAGTITGRGGYHWLYRTTKHVTNRAGLLPGVDIRGEGGYIVAPPSIHPNGRQYEWEQDISDYGIAPLDSNILELIQDNRRQSSFTITEQVQEGMRNETIFKLACSLQRKGLSDAAIMAAAEAENTSKCVPPLSDQEVSRIVGSALRYDKGHTERKTGDLSDYNYYDDKYTSRPVNGSENVKQEPQRTSSAVVDDFLDTIQTEAYKPIKTELPFFDELLGGGVIPQTLMLLMAAPSAGKTTLMQQVAEAMAVHGKKVVYLNLEMSAEQMLAKAISARLYRSDRVNRTAIDILQGYKWSSKEREEVTATIQEYKQESAPYIQYNPAGVGGDLDRIIEYLTRIGEEAQAAGEPAPVVVLDYLHLVSCSRLDDIKEIIKQTVEGLKKYAVKYHTFVVAITAINRPSQKGKITMTSGRDSSNLEYEADTQLALDFYEVANKKVDADDKDAMDRLKSKAKWKMELRLIKNRFGIPGRRATVFFEPANNEFTGTYKGFEPVDNAGNFDDDEQTTINGIPVAGTI